MCLQRDDLNMVTKVLQDDDDNGRLSPSAQRGLASLSLDQILAILRFLPVQSIIAFGITCKRFWEITEGDDLWAFICIREWGSQAVQTWPMLEKEKGWKRVFRQMLMLKAGSWRKVDQGDVMPAARASHSLSTVAGMLTVFGGGCQGGRHLDDTWIASLPTEISEGVAWHQSSSGSPSGRFGQSCNVVDDSLVLFGGINDKGVRQCDTWINRGVSGRKMHEIPVWELFDVVTSPPPRGAHAGCFGGVCRVVIFGGINTEGNRLGDTWVLDLEELPSTWHEVLTPTSPPARSGHTLTWIGGRKMILFGGRGTRFEVLNDVWLLDMEGDSAYWVELRPCELQPIYDRPAARAGHSATLIFGGRILIFGGEDARRSRKGDVWVLDPRAGVQVGYGSSCNTSYPQKLLSEDKLAPRFWKKLEQWGQLPTRRSFHGACALESGHSILVFGGMVDGELFPGATGLGFDAEMHMLQLVP